MTRKLLLNFTTLDDKDKTKTINNVREASTDEELRGFATMYSTLTTDLFQQATLVESRTL